MTPEEKKKKDLQTIKDGSTALGQVMTKKYISPTQQDDIKRYPTPIQLRLLSGIAVAADAIETLLYIHHGLTSHDNVLSVERTLKYMEFVGKTLPSDHGVNLVVKKEWAPGGYSEIKAVGIEPSTQIDISKPDSNFSVIPIMGQQPATQTISNAPAKTWAEEAEYHNKLFNCAKGIEDAVCGDHPDLVDKYKKVIDGVKEFGIIEQPAEAVENTTIINKGPQYDHMREETSRFFKRYDDGSYTDIPPTTPDQKPTDPDVHAGPIPAPSEQPIPPTTPAVPDTKPTNPDDHSAITPTTPVQAPPPTQQPGTGQDPDKPQPPADGNLISDDNSVHFASVEATASDAHGPEAYAASTARINAVYDNILSHTRALLKQAQAGAGGQGNNNGAPQPVYHINVDKLRTLPGRTKDDSYKAAMESLQKAFFALLDCSEEFKQVYKRVEATEFELKNIDSIMQIYGHYRRPDEALQSGDLVFFANPDEYQGGCWAVLIGVKDRNIGEALICHNPDEGYSITNTFVDKSAYMGEIVKVWSPVPHKIFSTEPQLDAFWGPNLLRYRGFLDNENIYASDLYTELFKGTKYAVASYEEMAAIFGDEIKPLSQDVSVMPGQIVFNGDDGVAVVLKNAQLKGRVSENNHSNFVGGIEWKDFKATAVWAPHL